jgi:A/G-specific adenine glycosylase
VEEPLPGAKAKLLALGKSLVPHKRAGDFAQALMDLGSGICTVKRPACAKCPWTDECEARQRDTAEALPAKAPKRARPLRRGAAFVARDAKGAVLLVKRPENGLLGGMLQPPLGPWGAAFPSAKEALAQAPFRAVWKKLPGLVRHTFTHFELEIEVWTAEKKEKLDGRVPPGHDKLGIQWTNADDLKDAALPTVMRKIIAHAFDAQAKSARMR